MQIYHKLQILYLDDIKNMACHCSSLRYNSVTYVRKQRTISDKRQWRHHGNLVVF